MYDCDNKTCVIGTNGWLCVIGTNIIYQITCVIGTTLSITCNIETIQRWLVQKNREAIIKYFMLETSNVKIYLIVLFGSAEWPEMFRYSNESNFLVAVLFQTASPSHSNRSDFLNFDNILLALWKHNIFKSSGKYGSAMLIFSWHQVLFPFSYIPHYSVFAYFFVKWGLWHCFVPPSLENVDILNFNSWKFWYSPLIQINKIS